MAEVASKEQKPANKSCKGSGTASGTYLLGLIGALVFYMEHAHTFWAVVLGILKSFVWPAFLVYHLFAS